MLGNLFEVMQQHDFNSFLQLLLDQKTRCLIKVLKYAHEVGTEAFNADLFPKALLLLPPFIQIP